MMTAIGTLFLLCSTSLISWVLWYQIGRMRRAKQAQQWPIVTGTVLRTEVVQEEEVHRDGAILTFDIPVVTYAY